MDRLHQQAFHINNNIVHTSTSTFDYLCRSKVDYFAVTVCKFLDFHRKFHDGKLSDGGKRAQFKFKFKFRQEVTLCAEYVTC